MYFNIILVLTASEWVTMAARDVEIVTSICRKLSPQELIFLLSASNEKIHSILGDILYNCCLNEKVFSELKKNKKFKKFKSSLGSNKADILKLLKSKSKVQRQKMLKKQVGSGVLSILASLLVGVLPVLFNKK